MKRNIIHPWQIEISNMTYRCDSEPCRNKAKYTIGYQGFNGNYCHKHINEIKKKKWQYPGRIRTFEQYKRFQDRLNKEMEKIELSLNYL